MVTFSHKELFMNSGDTIWYVYDNRWKCIAESGDNSLPFIFDNENDALDCAEQSKLWEVRRGILKLMY